MTISSFKLSYLFIYFRGSFHRNSLHQCSGSDSGLCFVNVTKKWNKTCSALKQQKDNSKNKITEDSEFPVYFIVPSVSFNVNSKLLEAANYWCMSSMHSICSSRETKMYDPGRPRERMLPLHYAFSALSKLQSRRCKNKPCNSDINSHNDNNAFWLLVVETVRVILSILIRWNKSCSYR